MSRGVRHRKKVPDTGYYKAFYKWNLNPMISWVLSFPW